MVNIEVNGGTRSGWFLRAPICCLECFFPGLAKAHHPKHISDHFANSEAFGCWFAWLLAHVTCPSPTALGLLVSPRFPRFHSARRRASSVILRTVFSSTSNS